MYFRSYALIYYRYFLCIFNLSICPNHRTLIPPLPLSTPYPPIYRHFAQTTKTQQQFNTLFFFLFFLGVFYWCFEPDLDGSGVLVYSGLERQRGGRPVPISGHSRPETCMPRSKNKHTHQYIRIYPYTFGVSPIDKTRGVWACALPDCTHYMPLNVANQVVGKLSLCNTCMQPFVLEPENMKLDKPICDTCANPSGVPTISMDKGNWERFEVRSFLAGREGKEMKDITEEEIDKWVQIRRLNMK